MSKFNKPNSNTTVNECGTKAYKLTPEQELTSIVLTSFYESKYYKNNVDRIPTLVDKVSNEFLAKLVLFTRNECHMRSTSHSLAAYLCNKVKNEKYVKNVIKTIIERPDDATEIMSFYISTFGKPIPNSLKKGISLAFNKFDEYQLAKYNRKGKVTFKDLFMLCHIKPLSFNNKILFKKLLDDKLKVPYTWETELSTKGNTKEVWEQLIDSNKLGYMAKLRNLNNIINSNANNINKVLEDISNPELVEKSKQLPFRFYNAYKTLKDNNLANKQVFLALENAIKASTQNIDKLAGNTLIAIDTSGSMTYSCNKNSTAPINIACIMTAITDYICEYATIVKFNDVLEKITFYSNDILKNAESIRFNDGGTNMILPLEYAINSNNNFDRIIYFTDSESNQLRYNRSCQNSLSILRQKNPNIWCHTVDLAGYGTTQFTGKNTNFLSGWNENIISYIKKTEQSIDSMINHIINIPLDNNN